MVYSINIWGRCATAYFFRITTTESSSYFHLVISSNASPMVLDSLLTTEIYLKSCTLVRCNLQYYQHNNDISRYWVEFTWLSTRIPMTSYIRKIFIHATSIWLWYLFKLIFRMIGTSWRSAGKGRQHWVSTWHELKENPYIVLLQCPTYFLSTVSDNSVQHCKFYPQIKFS